MALTLNIPQSPPSANSPGSDDSNSVQRSPNSPNASFSPSATQPNATKRKPSRRANTAERRATHNAVERQRRETLNGRFLDLAALLPNLSQIRRPSKSSIVNSSIAYLQASRRHRLMASRELRNLKVEVDNLRREVNEWRDRFRMPRVEEAVRGEGYAMVLSGELEVLSAVPEEEEEHSHGYEGDEDAEEEFGDSRFEIEKGEDQRSTQSPVTISEAHNVNTFGQSFARSNTHGSDVSRPLHGQAIVQNATPFDHLAMASLLEPQVQNFQGGVPAAWNEVLFNSQTQGRAFINSQLSHSMVSPIASESSFPDAAGNSFLANYPQQQLAAAVLPQSISQMYSPPEVDDTSSVGSGRSGSSGHGSGYCTPSMDSPTASYDLLLSAGSDGLGEFGIPRRLNAGGQHIAAGNWCQPCDNGPGIMGMMKPHVNSPISVGGGGGGFLMMA
jgi:hypothetical protein